MQVRGLAHPEHWQGPQGALFDRFGAVKASPMAAYKLLRQGESVLLFPGGGREARLTFPLPKHCFFWPVQSFWNSVRVLQAHPSMQGLLDGLIDCSQTGLEHVGLLQGLLQAVHCECRGSHRDMA